MALELSPYFNSYAYQNMYQQRNYYQHSSYRDLVHELYNYWDDIIISPETVPMYLNFFHNYNPKVNQLMMVVNPKREDDAFIDDNLYITSLNIIDVHIRNTDDNKFKSFLVRIKEIISNLHGKSFIQVRAVLFGNGCTPLQQLLAVTQSGYCPCIINGISATICSPSITATSPGAS